MLKVKKFVKTHRFSLFFFSVVVLYNFIFTTNFNLWEVDTSTYAFHAVDFSMGFCTRIIQGAICNFFINDINFTSVSIYLTVILLVFFAAVSFFLEKVILSVNEDSRACVLIFAVFFLTGPSTFSMHVKWMGSFDFYWLVGVLLFFVFLSKKQLYPLIIFVFLFEVMVYYASVICYIPFLAIILLYKISCTDEKREKKLLWIVFFLSVILTIALIIYMVLFESDNVNYSFEEFSDIMHSRGADVLENYHLAFYENTLDADKYKEYLGKDLSIIAIDREQSFIMVLLQMFVQRFQLGFQLENNNISIFIVVLIIPIVLFVFSFNKFLFEQKKADRLKRFTSICVFLLFFLTIVIGRLVSTDVNRWIMNSYIPLCIFFFYISYHEKDILSEWFSKSLKNLSIRYLIPYVVIYMFVSTRIV